MDLLEFAAPPKRSELEKLFGPIDLSKAGDSVPSYMEAWPDWDKWMTTVQIPIHGRFKLIDCHKYMAGPLTRAFKNVVDRELLFALHTYDGCWVIRNTRGKSTLSVHSYGLAIDLNAATNRLGTAGDMNPLLVECFTDEGFHWGGDYHRPDFMHFAYCDEAN